MRGIRYRSTKGFAKTVNFKEAILRGQAPDGGLYVPEVIPTLSLDIINSMKSMTYPEIAFTVLNEFLKDEIPSKELRRITEESYNFDVPLEKVFDRKYIMRMDRSRTLSFKDFATRPMGRLMQYYMKDENKRLIILTATSGDTGSAVADAFHGLDNIDVVILFPEKEVTDRQRKQMTTLGKNITTLAVAGKFDDCQAMVKEAFADSELDYLNLSSANSINWGRLLPQTIQYFYAYSRVADEGEEIVVAVPCGNYGHLTGGIYAKEMGVPIHRFISASNENDEVVKFFETCIYTPVRPSKACISNAMNVGHPSNLARIFDFYGGNMDEKGIVKKMPSIEKMKEDIFAISISDDETRKTIKEVYERRNIILEPHGAVGWAGLMRYLEGVEDWNPCVSFETAHPAKFPEEIIKTINVNPEIPKILKDLEKKKENCMPIKADYDVFKNLLKSL